MTPLEAIIQKHAQLLAEDPQHSIWPELFREMNQVKATLKELEEIQVRFFALTTSNGYGKRFDWFNGNDNWKKLVLTFKNKNHESITINR